MFFNFKRKDSMPDADAAIKGRATPIAISEKHYVNGHSMFEPYPGNTQIAMFGAGCFWGIERKFWSSPGVYVTAVGYSGGYTQNPTYREVCTGMTGHNEVVRVVFHLDQLSYDDLLRVFWESHDPTQGMRQGNDIGTQYRSGIYTYGEQQHDSAQRSLQAYSDCLREQRFGAITTEVVPASDFYFAEELHQQYLAKNPGGYCGIGGTGVRYCTAEMSVASG